MNADRSVMVTVVVAERSLRLLRLRLEANARRKRPAVMRTIDAHVRRPRLHAKGVEKPVVVVWIAVAGVNGDVELVCAFDEIEALDRKRDFGLTLETFWIHLLDEGVRAIAAHAVSVEEAQSKHEIRRGCVSRELQAYRHRITGVEYERLLA